VINKGSRDRGIQLQLTRCLEKQQFFGMQKPPFKNEGLKN